VHVHQADDDEPVVTAAELAAAQEAFAAGATDVWALVDVEKRHLSRRVPLHADSLLKRGMVARDRFGDAWRRGNTRWTCLSPVDGERIQSVARLPHSELLSQYGPVVQIRTDGIWDYKTIRGRR
jgi:hypothetical protein